MSHQGSCKLSLIDLDMTESEIDACHSKPTKPARDDSTPPKCRSVKPSQTHKN